MTPDQFTNWLSGFISALGSNTPTDEQFNTVKDNLGKVFNKVTPNRLNISNPKTAQEKLDCELIGGLTPIQDTLHKAFNDFNYGITGRYLSGEDIWSSKGANEFFGLYPQDNSTRALLENYTGPSDGEAQLLTC